MVQLSKQSARPIPINMNEVSAIVDEALANATYDQMGLLVKFNTTKILDIVDAAGQPIKVNIHFYADPKAKRPGEADYRIETKTIRIFYSDLRAIYEIMPPNYNQIYEYVIDGSRTAFELPPTLNKRRKEIITTNILHELTHAKDPVLNKHGPSMTTNIRRLVQDPNRKADFQRAYYAAPEEIRAHLAQVIYELKSAYEQTPSGLRDLFKHSLTLQQMLKLYGKDLVKKEVINKLYAAMYQWFVDNNLNPVNGNRIEQDGKAKAYK